MQILKQPKASIVILIIDTKDIQVGIIRGKEGYFQMRKGSIHQEDTRILNLYTCKLYTCIYNLHMKDSFKIHKAKLDGTKRRDIKIPIITGHFNKCLSITDKTSRQKLSKSISDLDNKLNKLDFTVYTKTIFKNVSILKKRMSAYTLFSNAQRMCIKLTT